MFALVMADRKDIAKLVAAHTALFIGLGMPDVAAYYVMQVPEVVESAYRRAKPTLETLHGSLELASMAASGVWDPNWEPPYKRNRNSDE